MRKNIEVYYKILLFVALGILLIPLAQKKFHFVNDKTLSGDITIAPDTSFTINGWFFGDYTSLKEKYLNDNFGFRNYAVCFRNQMFYSCFDRIFANGVMCGKDGYLFETKYLKAHAGLDFVGETKIADTYRKLKFIQDTLDKIGKKLLIIYSPGKASFFPEKVPAAYSINSVKTNYLYNVKYAKELGVNYIDFNQWFIQNKTTSLYPLYPQTGTHWSVYGMYLAFDSLNRYLSKTLNKQLPTFEITKIDISDSLRSPDGDIGDGLNLLEEVPHFAMAYPTIKWNENPNFYKPRVLMIADSYWMSLYFLNMPYHAYTDHYFWYYNSLVYAYDEQKNKLKVRDLDLKSRIDSSDVIIIMSTEATIKQIGWGFINDVYDMFTTPVEKYEDFKVRRKINAELSTIRINIENNPEWLKTVKKQANQLNISLDSCLKLNTEYVYKSRYN